MKLSKPQAKAHNQACELLKQNILSEDDKRFIIDNWHEGATNMNGSAGAFFTPFDLAKDFQLAIMGGAKIIDLCAGIGCLSYLASDYSQESEIHCVEINPEYYEIGKKIVPGATWHLADALDLEFLQSLGPFDQAISNPPFGNIKTGHNNKLKYTGADFEFKIIEIASLIAKHGAFILPQASTPFKYSGELSFSHSLDYSAKAKKFQEQTGLEFEFNCGIDTSHAKTLWRGVSPTVEIVTFSF